MTALHRLRRLVLLPAALFACFSACGGDSGSGSLIVNFRLGNAKTCQDVGVSKIEVALSPEISTRVDCTAGTQVQFTDVPSGSYEVVIRGLDASGVVVMDNQAAQDQAFAEVLADGQTTTPEIGLTSVPAHLYARWNIEFGSCASAGIDRFEFRAWDASGTSLLHSYSIPCTQDGDPPDFYRAVPDPERKIDGNRFSEASVTAIRLDGTQVGSLVKYVLPKTPGPGYFVKLTVSCTSTNGCVAEGPASICGTTCPAAPLEAAVN